MLIKVQLDATVCRHLFTATLNHDARNHVFKILVLSKINVAIQFSVFILFTLTRKRT